MQVDGGTPTRALRKRGQQKNLNDDALWDAQEAKAQAEADADAAAKAQRAAIAALRRQQRAAAPAGTPGDPEGDGSSSEETDDSGDDVPDSDIEQYIHPDLDIDECPELRTLGWRVWARQRRDREGALALAMIGESTGDVVAGALVSETQFTCLKGCSTYACCPSEKGPVKGQS